ncbi:MAG: pyridoxal phosphate-dependent aminotransferase [Acidobacteria bacterium]|nr:pyridoxal phosphate-dependent aminotransferase [Acidobacteriota bacterium]
MADVFTRRLDWNLHPNRISEALARRRAQGLPILDLTESNPTTAGLDYPAAEIAAAFDIPAALVYQPAPAGLAQARETVAAYYAGRGVAVDPGQILMTASTSEAYAYLFKLLADPGDEILAPRPSYPLFEFLAGLESVRLVHYPLLYDHGWMIDFARLGEATSAGARAVVIVNPNNPTGSFIKREELEQLVDFCAQRGLAIIADEVFSDYTFGADPWRVETLASVTGVLTFSLSGLSKVSGLPQMKLGWIVAGGPPELRQTALERLELIADTYLSVGAPVQHAFPRLLPAGVKVKHQIQLRTETNLSFLRSSMTRDSACRALPVEGGWYAVLQVPRVHTEEEWTLALLDRDGVLVQPGFFFDFESEAYLVVSLLTESGVFQEGIRRLLGRCG